MGGENWKATDVLGEYANSPWRGNKGLKHGNRGEETGARDAWMILLGLLETFTMLVFWGHNEDSTREKFILVTPGTVLSTQHSLYSPNYVLYNSLDHTHTHTQLCTAVSPWEFSTWSVPESWAYLGLVHGWVENSKAPQPPRAAAEQCDMAQGSQDWPSKALSSSLVFNQLINLGNVLTSMVLGWIG